ncbi:hypothetical protein TrispH2_011894, partial [Trichoplax sp. H2]
MDQAKLLNGMLVKLKKLTTNTCIDVVRSEAATLIIKRYVGSSNFFERIITKSSRKLPIIPKIETAVMPAAIDSKAELEDVELFIIGYYR